MRNLVLWGSVALAVGAAFACGGSSSSNSADDAVVGDPTAEGGAVLPPSGVAPQGPAGTGLDTGLPCDVQAVLEDRCLACHSGMMAAAPPLLTYDDLMAKSKVDPTKTLAQLSLDRMKSTTSPMPPPPAVPPDADEIKTFSDWVAAGTPKGAVCTDPPPASDGGAVSDGGDAGGAASKCTSGKTWTGGNTKSPLMHPGTACNACHQVMGGPNLRIAGTVFPTLHEPNDCDGKSPPPTLTVIITDKNGKVTNLPANAAGNFYTQNKILPPYKAKITDGVTTRAMNGSVTAGDCNSCHTETGANGAPGRVMAP